ncbi:hypothetical protein Hanom_Chr15g01372781 [Helianthus anomalus]
MCKKRGIWEKKSSSLVGGTKVEGSASMQLAGDAFTYGTIAVLPFYTLMVAAPKAELVRFYGVMLPIEL